MLKHVLAAAALAALAACGQSDEGGAPAAGGGGAGEVTLGATRTLPDWLLFLRTQDGGNVHFNQRSITRAADGTADLWIQIQHGHTQVHVSEDSDTTRTIAYVLERRHYRFNCAAEQFTILNRQFMDSMDVVAAEAPDPDALMRPVPPSGIARAALPIACRGR